MIKNVSYSRPRWLWWCCLLATLCAGRAAAAAPSYVMTALGTLGGTDSQALALNDSGQIVGVALLKNGSAHAFLYAGGGMTDLGVLAGYGASEAEAINNAGQIAGYGNDANGNAYAFLYANGKTTNLGVLAGDANEQAFGINSSGQVVGASNTSTVASFDENAVLYANGKTTKLGPLPGGFDSHANGINDNGQAAGYSDTNQVDSANNIIYHAVRYAAGGGTFDVGARVPASSGLTDSVGTAINAGGNVTGFAYATGMPYQAFVYSNASGFKLLGKLPRGENSLAFGMNATGAIVGQGDIGAVDGQGLLIYHAWVYLGTTMYDLNSCTVNAAGWRIQFARGINAVGQIAGYAINPTGHFQAILLTPLAIAAPVITTQPKNWTVKPGASATFTVAALGAPPLTVIWNKNGVPVPGATTGTLSLTKIVAGQAGNYTAVVSNKVGNTTSNTAVLVVNSTPPAIATAGQPKSVLNVKAGATVTFRVTATGDAPLKYQWWKDGAPLANANNYSGATTLTLTIKKASAANSGSYWVVVSNAAGTKTSNQAQLQFK
jgi:probable HAF family extracellular repeat protein